MCGEGEGGGKRQAPCKRGTVIYSASSTHLAKGASQPKHITGWDVSGIVMRSQP